MLLAYPFSPGLQANSYFATALLQLDMGRPVDALEALVKVTPREALVGLTAQYGHLLAPAPAPAPTADDRVPAVEGSGTGAYSLGVLLRLCAPSLLLQILQRAGGNVPLAEGLALVRAPLSPHLAESLRSRPTVANALAEAAAAVPEADLLRQYLERCGPRHMSQQANTRTSNVYVVY